MLFKGFSPKSSHKWQHFLDGRQFTLVTDQPSVVFMFDNRK